MRINLGNGRIQTLRSFLCHKQKRISMNSSAYPKFIPRARRLCISQVRDKPRITLYRANVPKRKRQWYQWWQWRLYIYRSNSTAEIIWALDAICRSIDFNALGRPLVEIGMFPAETIQER